MDFLFLQLNPFMGLKGSGANPSGHWVKVGTIL